jgi:tRNA pseudouridine32 synthase/23S rRNA pseudouridine746 synthase
MKEDQPLPIVYADASLIAIDKPAGLLAVPGIGEEKQHRCAAALLQRRHADALVVHRLDQPTSGLMLFARGAGMRRALGIAFERREVDKRYIAVVAGEVQGEHGSIDLPLAADGPNRPRQRVDAVHGKPSSTRWRVLERGAGTTRLELQPLTGRSHQLRVHLLAIGHPIAGDALYAPPDVQALAPRLLLHAWRLGLAHPASGEALSLHCEAPF